MSTSVSGANERVRAYRQNSGKHPETPLAVLRIPRISLEAPLFDGTDDLTLNHAVGRIAGTSRPGEPGNIGIAGHRDGFFRGLKDVRVGDAIELKTLKGTDTYVVDQIQIVSPRQVEVLRLDIRSFTHTRHVLPVLFPRERTATLHRNGFSLTREKRRI